MTRQLDAEKLREGACLALEHCTRLAEDSATMYAAKRFATSFCLAVMAREELGRFNLLWEQSVALADDGVVCADTLAERLKPHEEKIRAGQSIVAVPMEPDEMRRWDAAITANDTDAIDAISAAVRKRAATVRKHAPSALHKRRLQAQYVDLDPVAGTWSSPSSIDMTEAQALVRTVMAEIANVLIAASSNRALLQTAERVGLQLPRMGPFTQNVLARLVIADA